MSPYLLDLAKDSAIIQYSGQSATTNQASRGMAVYLHPFQVVQQADTQSPLQLVATVN